MKFQGLFCVLVLTVVFVSASARRGKNNRRTNTFYKRTNYRDVAYVPYNRKGYQGITCSDTIDYVCGNDGQTYQNFCQLMKAMCTSTCLKFAYYGQCRQNAPRECSRCSSSVYWPYNRNAYKVCGTDGVTYNTRCELCRQKCLTGNNELDVDYKGCCVPSPTPSNDVPESTTAGIDLTSEATSATTSPTVAMTTPCRTDCPLEVETVCGTDSVTYPSPCVLNAVKCTTKPDLEIASEGPCRGDA